MNEIPEPPIPPSTPPAPPSWPAPPPPPPPPPLGWSPPPPPPPPAGKRGRAVFVASLALILAVVGAIVIVSRSGGKSYPDQWDQRVVDLVRFDEQARGLQFKHPVAVDFLTPEEYSDRTRTDSAGLSAEELQQLEHTEGELRAFGLVAGDVDLLDAANDIQDSGTSAFYDPIAERIIVRGTEMSVDLRVTLVHELVHALQDQHFDIEKTRSSLTTSGEEDAYRALIEGDATRIENKYIDQLSEAETEEYHSAHGSEVDRAKEGLIEVPAALQAFVAAPYEFGEVLLGLLEADGGNAAVDEAFRNPPSTHAQLLDPRAYFDRRDALSVDTPALPDGVSESVDDGDLGALTWYLVLAQRIDPFQALAAADGWGGDAYVAYSQDDRTCIRAAFRGSSDQATSKMRSALQSWVAAGPSGVSLVADVADVADNVQITSCDPGAAASVNDEQRALQAFLIADVRVQGMQDAVENGGVDLDKGWAYGDCFAHRLTFDHYVALTDLSMADDLPSELQAVIQSAQTSCIREVT